MVVQRLFGGLITFIAREESEMNSKEELIALCRIQKQLHEWASHVPEWYYLLHGNKEINETIQLMKAVINNAESRCLQEEWELIGNNLNNMYPSL